MASRLRRSLFGRKQTNKVSPANEDVAPIPTNELIVNDWLEQKSKNESVFILKMIDQMPKYTTAKKKGKKGSKKGKKLYAGKLKFKTCPHVFGNLYCPEHIVEKFRENHDSALKKFSSSPLMILNLTL